MYKLKIFNMYWSLLIILFSIILIKKVYHKFNSKSETYYMNQIAKIQFNRKKDFYDFNLVNSIIYDLKEKFYKMMLSNK